jgi:sugar O-acyltransferase (sialic acid O-acetyltransferase NeuD family)
MQDLIIVGAGGFGREVYSLVEQINSQSPAWRVLGFLDDNRDALLAFGQYPPILGCMEDGQSYKGCCAVCAIGNPAARRTAVDRLNGHGIRWATLIHPTASVGPGSVLGEGTVLCRGATVTTNVTLGKHVHLNCYATVGHDAVLGDHVTLSGHVDVCGNGLLDKEVFCGSHAVVLPNAHVGSSAVVGAGSVVLRYVAPGTTVFGVPAKRIASR